MFITHKQSDLINVHTKCVECDFNLRHQTYCVSWLDMAGPVDCFNRTFNCYIQVYQFLLVGHGQLLVEPGFCPNSKILVFKNDEQMYLVKL